MIPSGVLANSAAIILGGVLGTLLRNIFPKRIVEIFPRLLGLSAMAIGVVNIVKATNISYVVLALLAGTVIGEALSLEARATNGIHSLKTLGKESEREIFLSLIVLFSMSGTGIFGALHSGLSQDHSVLYAKAVLDFFTAFSFSLGLGFIVSTIALAQFVVQIVFYLFGLIFVTSLSPSTISNFQAVGGLITFAIGLKLFHDTPLRILNLTPALLLALLFA